MAIRIPTGIQKGTFITIGSALITASPFLPSPWSIVAAAVGGLLGGKELLRRSGDVEAKP